MIAEKILPAGFIAEMKSELGAETAKTLLATLSGSEPETSIRLNHRKSMDAEALYPGMTPVEWCGSGFYLEHRPAFTFDPLFHAGVYYVQDASSMIYEGIVRQLTDGMPVKVADLCAAPGGKTTAMLNALPDGSVMLANEYMASRAKILKENLTKYGYPEVVVTGSDVTRLSALKGYFDIVAVDAPCSGEGMMRKEEAARTQWSEGLVAQCSSLQREIIESAVKMTAAGGYLIYSTCTFNTAEDEDNASWIADTFGLEPVDTGYAGKYGIRHEVKGNVPCLRFMPGFTKGEGLFVAVFRKPAEEESIGGAKKTRKTRKTGGRESRQATDKALLQLAGKWTGGFGTMRVHDNRILALGDGSAALLDMLPSDVRIISAGVEVGETKGRDLIPSHHLAMSGILAPEAFPDIPLTREEALLYLSREAITLPDGTPKGYVTVSYAGRILGYMKHHGNRSNNLYPMDYRIRTRIQN